MSAATAPWHAERQKIWESCHSNAGGGAPAAAPAVLDLAAALGPGALAEGQHRAADGSMAGFCGQAVQPTSARREDSKNKWNGATYPHSRASTYETPQRPRRRAGYHHDETPTKAARAAQQLRQLLDFYFEPFNLQHNRYLLGLIARRLGPPQKAGPWSAMALGDFSFSFEDLMGLGRIATALRHLNASQYDGLSGLKHLSWSNDGLLQLRSPPEVRSLVPAADADPKVAAAALHYLAAVREDRGEAPPCLVTVLGYTLQVPLTDSVRGAQRQAQLKRQLLLHHTDVLCLHRLDPEAGGRGITTTLVEEGYCFTFARGAHGECNSIFWDGSRFRLAGCATRDADLRVSLQPFEEPSALVQVACVRPEVPTSSSEGLGEILGRSPRSAPLVVSADLSLLGGCDSIALVEEFADLRSLTQEVLGEELQTPLGVAPEDAVDEEGLVPVRAGASDFVHLHRPDALLFDGAAPLLSLSGYSERYLVTLESDDVVQLFPAFRVPIVAAFAWQSRQADEAGASASK